MNNDFESSLIKYHAHGRGLPSERGKHMEIKKIILEIFVSLFVMSCATSDLSLRKQKNLISDNSWKLVYEHHIDSVTLIDYKKNVLRRDSIGNLVEVQLNIERTYDKDKIELIFKRNSKYKFRKYHNYIFIIDNLDTSVMAEGFYFKKMKKNLYLIIPRQSVFMGPFEPFDNDTLFPNLNRFEGFFGNGFLVDLDLEGNLTLLRENGDGSLLEYYVLKKILI